jgi:hypothetical protein
MMPALLEFHSEVERYMPHYPLISNQIGQEPDGNPVLYLGVMALIYRQYYPADQWLFNVVEDTYRVCKRADGLISRGPHKPDEPQAHDDYIGLVAASYASKNFIPAMEIYRRGDRFDWVYEDSIRTFYGRMPGFIAHVKLAAGVNLNLFDQVYFSLALLSFRDESGIQLDWVKVQLYELQPQRYWLIDKAVRYWKRKIKERGGMREVFKVYYGEQHMFTKWVYEGV